MNFFRTAGTVLFVSLLVASSMYALTTMLNPPLGPQPRLLLVGSSTHAHWQRTVAGARDAARKFGFELVVETANRIEQINGETVGRRINLADYDGVAVFPTDPGSQVKLPGSLCRRTKFVTVDRDIRNSERLCYVGYCQNGSGHLAARLVNELVPRRGKVLLLATTFSDDAKNSDVCERLAGFKETWSHTDQNDALPCPVIQLALELENGQLAPPTLSATLADSELAFIVALDSNAAEVALKALAERLETRHVPIISFDPNNAVFDAIDNGQIYSAIFDDPYYSGFTAIERLGTYHRADEEGLPKPGYGFHYLASEVVTKENLADIRRRAGSPTPASRFSTAKNYHVSRDVREAAPNPTL